MSLNNGTNLFSYFQSRMSLNNDFYIHQGIITDGQKLGSMNESGYYRIPGQNDIICNKSICGSREEPTWQFCF